MFQFQTYQSFSKWDTRIHQDSLIKDDKSVKLQFNWAEEVPVCRDRRHHPRRVGRVEKREFHGATPKDS